MADLRCKYCNWLNLEVQKDFVCKNCNKENVVIKEEPKKIQQSIKGGKK